MHIDRALCHYRHMSLNKTLEFLVNKANDLGFVPSKACASAESDQSFCYSKEELRQFTDKTTHFDTVSETIHQQILRPSTERHFMKQFIKTFVQSSMSCN